METNVKERRIEITGNDRNKTLNHETGRLQVNPCANSSPWPEADEAAAQRQLKDGKEAWLVCLAAFLIQVLVVGHLHVFGIYYVSFLEEFNDSKGKTSWIGSLAYGIAMVIAPVSSSIMNKYGPHVSVFLGTIMSCISLLISASMPNVETMFGTFSCMFGVGCCLAYTPTMTIANDYFDRYLTQAMGIMVAGSSTGTLVLSPVTQASISTYGWRNTMRGHAICILICLWSSYMMRPRFKLRRKSTTERIKKSMARKLMKDLQLWKNKVFLVWTFAIFLVMFGYYIPYVHLVSYATDVGIPPEKGSLLLMVLGGVTAFGRILFGKIMEIGYLNRLHMHQLSMVITGTAAMMLPLITTFGGLIIYVVFVGLVDGCYVVLLPVLTTTLIDNDSVLAWGYLTMICSVTFMGGPVVAGMLYDATGSYNVAFHVAGVPLLAGATILFFIPWAQKTANATNVMTAVQSYAVMSHVLSDEESLGSPPLPPGELDGGIQMKSIPASPEQGTPVHKDEVSISLNESFLVIELNADENYLVPRTHSRIRRESMCSDLGSIPEVLHGAVQELRRQGTLEGSQKGSPAGSLATSPRSKAVPIHSSGTHPITDNLSMQSGWSSAKISIVSPRQLTSPTSQNQGPLSAMVSLATSPRSYIDSPTPIQIATSPRQVVVTHPIGASHFTSDPELQPTIRVELSHRPPVPAVPDQGRAVHYVSNPDILDSPRQMMARQGTQPHVCFTSNPTVDTMDQQTQSPADAARNITSNPDILLLQGPANQGSASVRPTAQTSNPNLSQNCQHGVVKSPSQGFSSTNPFSANYMGVQKEMPVKHHNSICSDISTEVQPSHSTTMHNVTSPTNISITVGNETKVVDVSAFDPINSPPPAPNVIDNAGVSGITSPGPGDVPQFESATGEEIDITEVLSDFDPIQSPPPEDDTTPVQSPPRDIPMIPPPPPNSRLRRQSEVEMLPTTSDVHDLRNNHSGVSQNVVPLNTTSDQSMVSGNVGATDNTYFASNPQLVTNEGSGIEIPNIGEPAERPHSPVSPDTFGVFHMSDLNVDEAGPSQDNTDPSEQ